MADGVAVISAADAKFFDLLQGMIRSLRDQPQGRDLPLYIFDLGLTEAQRRWLLVQGATLRSLQEVGYRDDLPVHLNLHLADSRFPELFPGHQVYLWIDADAWVQRWEAVDAYIVGSSRVDLQACKLEYSIVSPK